MTDAGKLQDLPLQSTVRSADRDAQECYCSCCEATYAKRYACQTPRSTLRGFVFAALETSDMRHKRRLGESLVQAFLFFCGVVSILTTLGIVFVLGREALLFFSKPEVSVWEFFTTTKWQPAIGNFGIWPLVTATLVTSVIAVSVALPLGLAVALYLSESASPKARGTIKPIMEVLAGIPTVVYGYFALTFMTPMLRSIFGDGTVEIYNTASAGIVIGILILPLVASMSEDTLSTVPRSLARPPTAWARRSWRRRSRSCYPPPCRASRPPASWRCTPRSARQW